MEKLEYFCDPKRIGYTYPEKKWYENKKKQRGFCVRLPDKDGEFSILLHVMEQESFKIISHMTQSEKAAFILTGIKGERLTFPRYQEIVIFDGEETGCVVEMLWELTRDANACTVISDKPFAYQSVFDMLYLENGLAAVCEQQYLGTGTVAVTQELERPYYKRQKYMDNQTAIIYADGCKRLPFREFPRGSHFYDITFTGKYKKDIAAKRPDMAYFGLSKYLDTIVKLRYNTIVKEGKVNQYILKGNNKKLRNLERA